MSQVLGTQTADTKTAVLFFEGLCSEIRKPGAGDTVREDTRLVLQK